MLKRGSPLVHQSQRQLQMHLTPIQLMMTTSKRIYLQSGATLAAAIQISVTKRIYYWQVLLLNLILTTSLILCHKQPFSRFIVTIT